MAEVSDIAVYQKLSEVADELDQMAAQGATLVGDVALNTASKTVRGMATAVYKHIMSPGDEKLDS
jgi:ubiquinone biosynthesis protein UbiJ